MTRLRQYAGLLAVLLLAAPALAQKVGTSSFQFLKVMPVARATALGDAYATLASGAEAIFWNPAGMASVEGHDLSTTLTLWIFDTKQSALSYAASLGDWGTVGAQVQFVDYGKIEETRVDQLQFVGSGGDRRYNPGLTGSTFSPSAYVVGLSYARRFTERFSMGARMRGAGGGRPKPSPGGFAAGAGSPTWLVVVSAARRGDRRRRPPA